MVRNMKKKSDEEFKEFLGEPLNDFTLSEEGKKEYDKILELATIVNTNILYGSREQVYREALAKILKENAYEVKEEYTYYQEIDEGAALLVRGGSPCSST